MSGAEMLLRAEEHDYEMRVAQLRERRARAEGLTELERIYAADVGWHAGWAMAYRLRALDELAGGAS